jgi:hypothetical protein
MLVCVLRMLLGLGGVFLAFGMVVLAVRIGCSTMGLCCGLVMFCRLIMCVFHSRFLMLADEFRRLQERLQ